jgi:polar amino acid transport system substrate-binding protein
MSALSAKTQRKLFFLLALLFLIPVETVRSCEIRVWVPEGNIYPPFYLQDSSGNRQGLGFELTEVLLREAGCTPVYVALPFARAIIYLKEGKIDLLPNLTVTDERKAFADFIGPQLDETVLLVVQKNSAFAIETLDDFKNLPLSIGVDRGKVYGKAFEKKRSIDPDFRNKLDVVNEIDLNEKKLAIGRISGFLGFGYTTLYQMRTNPLYQDFAIHPFVVNRDWVYYGLSKKSIAPDILKKFQEAFGRATEKGSFEAVRKKYSARSF